jgi:transcriptional regulator with XRE-family HTH domain
MARRRRRYSGEPFGKSVSDLMADGGTTYRVLAERTGLSAGYLNHLVHGNRPVPSNEVIGALAKALGVDADYFLEYRVRAIMEKLQGSPELADRLYKRYG